MMESGIGCSDDGGDDRPTSEGRGRGVGPGAGRTDGSESHVAQHRVAGILSIGDELMLGETVDTNAAWVSRRLAEIGVSPVLRASVGDELHTIARAMCDLANRVDVLVSTGGLGPTDDDLTREALALALNEALIEDEEAIACMEARLASLGRTVVESNRVQARRPKSARVIPNDRGTAPGIAATRRAGERSCDVFCLPGPPNEMTMMFDRFVAPALRPAGDRVIRVRELHEYGLPESAIPARLGGLMQRGRNPVVGTSAKTGVVTCKVRFDGAAERAETELDEGERRVRESLEPFIFGSGDESLADVVVKLLRARGETVATAESCTGGMLATWLTERAGASDVFVGGWSVYSNEMKSDMLHVPAEMIERFGAVSKQVAVQLADGALAACTRAGRVAAHALAITGIAGPEGGSSEKPVGTVWIVRATHAAAAREQRTMRDVRMFRFPGERAVVRERAALAALAMLRLELIGRTETRLLWEQVSQCSVETIEREG